MKLPSDQKNSSFHPADSLSACVLDYLQNHLPGYPFEPNLDATFVQELRADFPDVDLLEQIKIFRWYLDNQTHTLKTPRATLRRWIAQAKPLRSR